MVEDVVLEVEVTTANNVDCFTAAVREMLMELTDGTVVAGNLAVEEKSVDLSPVVGVVGGRAEVVVHTGSPISHGIRTDPLLYSEPASKNTRVFNTSSSISSTVVQVK